MQPPFAIANASIEPGNRSLVNLLVSKLANHTPVTLPVHVIHGRSPGPTMFVSAAIHGDELNGVEIIRRLLRVLDPESLSGTLLAVPIVNAYGFIGRSRYLPDRRDLNRSFPGSPRGSLAARIANLLLTEIVARSQIGIDLHTAAIHRVNLPQIRCEFKRKPRLRELSAAFGAPVILESGERAGSLRKSARELGVDVLVYEGGEGLRFDEFAITAGVDGIIGVMREIGMLQPSFAANRQIAQPSMFANASAWVRAPEGGILRTVARIGVNVAENDVMGYVASPYEDLDVPVFAPRDGIVVGCTTLPIVNLGDALFHIAWSSDAEAALARGAIATPSEPVMDEDEIL